jgi:hypothetical protein
MSTFPRLFAACVLASLCAGAALGQNAFDANGNLLAQNAPIEQSRLLSAPAGPQQPGMTPDGVTLPSSSSASNDDSFGAQQILKDEQKPREFVLSGDASMFYTNNVALTRKNTISDSFFIGGAGMGWVHSVNPELQIQIGGRASIFRYVDTSSLDFEQLGAGAGFTWTPATKWGISIFGGYAFSELLDKHSNELLQDHEFTLGVQKIFAFNRVHSLTVGGLGSVGISDPFSAQRDQIAAYADYRISVTRRFDADLAYRLAGYFYNEGGRNDFNQTISLGLRYRFNPWMDLNGLLFFASNRSSKSVFNYDALNTGGSLAFTLHF